MMVSIIATRHTPLWHAKLLACGSPGERRSTHCLTLAVVTVQGGTTAAVTFDWSALDNRGHLADTVEMFDRIIGDGFVFFMSLIGNQEVTDAQ